MPDETMAVDAPPSTTLDQIADTMQQDEDQHRADAFRQKFESDFGAIEGTYEIDRNLTPTFRTTLRDKPVVVVGNWTRAGWHYTVNGNTLSLPGNYTDMTIEQRQSLLVSQIVV